MRSRAHWGALGVCLGLFAIANCSDDEAAGPPAGDSGTADGTTGGGDSGGGGSDANGGADTGAGGDTGTTDAGTTDAPTDAPPDASPGGGFTISAPVSVFAVPVGFAGTTTQHVVVASTSGGVTLRALADGALRGTSLTAASQPRGAVAYQTRINLGDGGTQLDDIVQFFNNTTQANSAWNAAATDWGLSQLLPPFPCNGCTFSDLAVGPAQVPPTGHVITANTGGADPRVGYSHYDAGASAIVSSITSSVRLKVGGVGPHLPVSAAQASVTQQGLVVAVPADGGAGGQLFVHDRTVADATHVGSAGESPRMIRCSEQVCIVTNSGSNNATVFTWNGAATVANITNVAVGNVPQGVDIKKTGANYVAVVANASAGTVNVVVLNASAGVVSNTTVTLTGCANPRSVSHVPGTDTYAVACTIDNKIVVRAL